MKKAIYGVTLFGALIGLTGCFGGDGTFTMTCTPEKDDSIGFDNDAVIVYEFNEDQLVTGYTAKATQKFDDEEMYNIYKTEQEEAIKDNTNENISYELETDDKNMILTYSMTIKNLNKNVETDEDKEALKASTILKNNEESGTSCKLDGIDKKDLK